MEKKKECITIISIIILSSTCIMLSYILLLSPCSACFNNNYYDLSKLAKKKINRMVSCNNNSFCYVESNFVYPCGEKWKSKACVILTFNDNWRYNSSKVLNIDQFVSEMHEYRYIRQKPPPAKWIFPFEFFNVYCFEYNSTGLIGYFYPQINKNDTTDDNFPFILGIKVSFLNVGDYSNIECKLWRRESNGVKEIEIISLNIKLLEKHCHNISTTIERKIM